MYRGRKPTEYQYIYKIPNSCVLVNALISFWSVRMLSAGIPGTGGLGIASRIGIFVGLISWELVAFIVIR
jgi:hypothetical protein